MALLRPQSILRARLLQLLAALLCSAMIIGVASACGGIFRLNFFRAPKDMKMFVDQLSAETRAWQQRAKPARSITFSQFPDLDYSLDSISVSLHRNNDGRWEAAVVRSKGPIGVQAKEDYLARRAIDIEYEQITINESSCAALSKLHPSIVERSIKAADPEWRRMNGDDGTCTCSSQSYSLFSDLEPKMDFTWGNGCFHAYSGWIHDALKNVEACLPAAEVHAHNK